MIKMDGMKEILVCYDIEDNKNRNKLFESLKDLGLISIQKSVMWGYLLPAEINQAKREFKKYCKGGNDRVFLADVTIADKIIQNSIGYQNEFNFYRKSYRVL